MDDMRILVIGGTLFYGRHFTEMALQKGHDVTLFTRGLHNSDLFPAGKRLQGDRDGGLTALESGEWDAVLDTCGYVPRVVRQSAELLKDRVERYAFVSSISVFSEEATAPVTEESPVTKLDDPATEVVDGATYGGLKALCEDEVKEIFGSRALVIRPGLIVGPYDSSDRFTYWPWRMHRGDEVLVPDRPNQAVQIIDARDLAAFTLHALETGVTGKFNATGPAEPYLLGALLEEVNQVVGGKATLVPASIEFLQEQEVKFWTELPLSLGDGNDATMRCDVSRAVGAGMNYRSLAETAKDTLAFALSRGENFPWRNGLLPETESRLLGAWKAR